MANKPSKMQQRLAMGGGRNKPLSPLGFGARAYPVPENEQRERLAREAANQEALKAPKKVVFMSREDVKSYDFNGHDEVLISISDTKTSPPAITSSPRDALYLHFNDHVTMQDEAMGLRWIQFEDGEKIADFVLKHTDKRNIIVHCNYGESRSKAVAVAIGQHTKRPVLRMNSYGQIQAFLDKNDWGNGRVHSIVCDALLDRFEELATD